MGKINDARKALLKAQLDNAVVEHVGDDTNDKGSYDEGTYRVFVPGGLREWNLVKADNEDAAKKKVMANLESKIDDLPETDQTNETVSPDNMKLKMKSTVRTGEEQ